MSKLTRLIIRLKDVSEYEDLSMNEMVCELINIHLSLTVLEFDRKLIELHDGERFWIDKWSCLTEKFNILAKKMQNIDPSLRNFKLPMIDD